MENAEEDLLWGRPAGYPDLYKYVCVDRVLIRLIFCLIAINQHLASKYLFVRLLRDTKHLQQKTMIHWATWLGSVVGVGILAFVVAEVSTFRVYRLSLLILLLQGHPVLFDALISRFGNLFHASRSHFSSYLLAL